MTLAAAAKAGLLEGAAVSGMAQTGFWQSGTAQSGISTGSGLSFVPFPRPDGVAAGGSSPRINGELVQDPPFSFVALSGASGTSSAVPFTAAVADSFIKVPTAGLPTATPPTAAIGDSFTKFPAVAGYDDPFVGATAVAGYDFQATMPSSMPSSVGSKDSSSIPKSDQRWPHRRRKKVEVVKSGGLCCSTCW